MSYALEAIYRLQILFIVMYTQTVKFHLSRQSAKLGLYHYVGGKKVFYTSTVNFSLACLNYFYNFIIATCKWESSLLPYKALLSCNHNSVY